tara:strand:- start:10890 stop:11102 length:213 start_codon:yes stop_codon:yes gene_type:complete
MKLRINGDLQIINSQKEPLTLDLIVKELGHNPKLIVIEFNGLIIERKKWAHQVIKNGDNLEIVTIVGGGS